MTKKENEKDNRNDKDASMGASQTPDMVNEWLESTDPEKSRQVEQDRIPKFLPLNDIDPNDRFRIRVKEDKGRIELFIQKFIKYSEDIDEKEVAYPFDPVVYWTGDGKKDILDGFHRYIAALRAKMETILAVEFFGTEEEAMFFAIRANSQHGLPYRYGDYQIAIRKILTFRPDIKIKELEDLTGASHAHCCNIRKEIRNEAEKVSCDPLTDTATVSEEEVVPAPPKPKKEKKKPAKTESEPDDEFDIVRWDRLENLPPTTQIQRYVHVLEVFEGKLDDVEKQTLYKQISRWLGKRSVKSDVSATPKP